MRKVGRNEPCPCGSGKKYKKCCLEKEKILKNPKEWIPMRIEDAKECEDSFERVHDARPEDAERWRMKSDEIGIERCRKICENFDNCVHVIVGQPNEPSECIEFYNEDMYKKFYQSKEEILEHIKFFGFIPNIINESKDEEENISMLKVNLCLKDGSPLFLRLYEKWGDKPWEFISQDCPIIGIGGSREVILLESSYFRNSEKKKNH